MATTGAAVATRMQDEAVHWKRMGSNRAPTMRRASSQTT
jgi:hypothetical protein